MKKALKYKITEEEIKYVEDHTFTMLYDDAIYWLYSERMSMYIPYLQKKKDNHVSLEDLLEYCKNQMIQVYPMALRNRKITTRIAAYRQLFDFKKRGILLKSSLVAKMIIEYSKYCIVNYPAQL